jgi:hypothetical protein
VAWCQIHLSIFVGSGSGRRSGIINDIPAIIRTNGVTSQEWSLTLLGERFDYNDGDAGAWVIRTEDNKLVGMLGMIHNRLLFTPIEEIFADIKQRLHAREVCLPQSKKAD